MKNNIYLICPHYYEILEEKLGPNLFQDQLLNVLFKGRNNIFKV